MEERHGRKERKLKTEELVQGLTGNKDNGNKIVHHMNMIMTES